MGGTQAFTSDETEPAAHRLRQGQLATPFS
jgi:hypothetical protein